ncbi:hypothetical protein CMI37_15780 [Candidatus Pacearchaeota archaeon]|nr:hypothetical protein [Candidatus Pacearchaeota archaeon]
MSPEFDMQAALAEINELSELASFVDTALTGAFQTEVTERIDTLESVVNSVNLRLFERLDALADVNAGLDAKIIGFINEQTEANNAITAGIDEAILNEITNVTREVDLTLNATESRIRTELQNELELTAQGQLGIAQSIAEVVREQVAEIEQDAEAIANKIGTGISTAITALDASIAVPVTKALDVATTLRDTLPSTLEALGPSLGTGLGDALGGFFGPLQGLMKLFSVGAWDEAFEQVEPIMQQLENDPFLGPTVKTLTPDGQISLGLIGIGVLAMIVTSVVQGAIGSTSAGPSAKATQLSMKALRPALMQPAEWREVLNRTGLPDGVAREELAMAGFPEPSISHLLNLRSTLLGVGELLSLWRRGEIVESVLELRLEALGYYGQNQDHLKTLAFAIPGPQDLILFSVREVFDIETSERFGQFEGVPPEVMSRFRSTVSEFGEGQQGGVQAFIEYAKQSGISEQWAVAYWASHWRLPGVTSLFDMIHRLSPDIVEARADDFREFGLNPDELGFELTDLDRTLRAQDYTPAFRQRLTAIAFRPITRVDVRRMHKLGLVDDFELVRRYRELGYSPRDAELMGAFTIDFNRVPDEIEDAETKDLTRTQVLKFFERGFLERDEAISVLEDIGYTSDVADAFVSLKQLDILDKQQDQLIAITREKFKAGNIGFNEAVTELDQLNLPALQRASILADFEAEVASRVRSPSMGQLGELAEAGLLTQTGYEDELLQQGFSVRWARLLTRLQFKTLAGELAEGLEDITGGFDG